MPLLQASRPALFLVILFALFIPEQLYGWSSVVPDFYGGRITAFATHQFLNQMAFEELKRHPAVGRGIVHFPSLDEIQDQATINQAQGGNGPDNPRLSEYSWHWYNPDPAVPGSQTTKIVARYFHGLKQTLLAKSLLTEGGSPRSSGAREAAYAAHFIQDMTCPFHVVGMPITDKNIIKTVAPRRMPDGSQVTDIDTVIGSFRNNAAMKRKIGGPYRNYTPEEWQRLVDLAAAAFNKDPKADWFDPNYYDGQEPYTTMNSGHFLYEAGVEIAYKKSPPQNELHLNHLRYEKKYISPQWTNSLSPEEFTRMIARETRQRMEQPGSNLAFDTRDPRNLLDPKVPYEDWWRAIQATYTLWRASFSALWIGGEDIKLVKLPNQPGMYEARVKVWNLEPEEEALSVNVVAQAPGREMNGGQLDVPGALPKGKSSDWLPLGKIRLDDSGNPYGNSPDHQRSVP